MGMWAWVVGGLSGPIVSADVIGDDASCVFYARLTQASSRFVKAFG
jgi:glyceraldehyde 3-phosphate dehydrogenase